MLRFFPAHDSELARRVAGGALVFLAVLAFALIMAEPHRADLTPPALRADRILAFRQDANACRDALASAQFATVPVPNVSGPGACGYSDAVEVATSVYPASQPIPSSCALAAGLMLWERDVVAKAAQQRLGTTVTEIEIAGAPFQCRPIAGRRDHRLSEHAYANAIDIGGFKLANGRVVTIAQSWRRGSDQEKAFLRDVRGGACRYFQAVLSPDYNRDHANHLHFDLGRDKICR
ncbi:MAG TPA: extensin family protein [Vitreimonas sp.]|nr:extensin family protein [Vitreimonas sp.]